MRTIWRKRRLRSARLGILVTTLAAPYLPLGGKRAAAAALVAGLATTPLAEYALGLPAPFLASILTALAVYPVIAKWELPSRLEAEQPEPDTG